MSIIINSDLCTGCGKCRKVCPGSLLFKEVNGSKTIIKYPDECWGCTSCLKECKFGAISFFLGADMGGQGSTMYVTEREEKLYWHITRKDGRKDIITVDKTKANSY